jgi:phosphonate transport system substrate-binding protein
MRIAWIILTGALVVLALGVAVWLGRLPSATDINEAGLPSSAAQAPPLRIGLIPERDIFEQRRRYRALADYLAAKLGRPVELVSSNTYEGVLKDFAEARVDAAFLGSLVATLAMDRHDAQVLLKPEVEGKVTTYRGVILVRADSPIQSVDDLAGHSIAMVKATTAGDLFPMFEMVRRGLAQSPQPPEIKWVGTHDAVIREVAVGRADAGSAKDLRLDAYEAAHPAVRIRRLAASDPVPNNALVIRTGVADEIGPALARIMLAMDREEAGRETLAAFGAVRFVPCRPEEYEAVYEMADSLGEQWAALGVSGPPPKRRGGRADPPG